MQAFNINGNLIDDQAVMDNFIFRDNHDLFREHVKLSKVDLSFVRVSCFSEVQNLNQNCLVSFISHLAHNSECHILAKRVFSYSVNNVPDVVRHDSIVIHSDVEHRLS